MSESSYEIIFAKEDDTALLLMAQALIGRYAEQGLMLAVTLKQLESIAAQGLLALALSHDRNTIGVAGITFEHPDGKKEFGGWAVDPAWKHSGVGKQLLQAVIGSTSGTVIAFGNHNSGPIFTKLGATILDQKSMHPSAFDPCRNCKCQGKEKLPEGTLCVDSIYDLTNLK